MSTCTECGKQYHWCSSCGYDGSMFDNALSAGYCSLECYKKSEYFQNNIKIIKQLWEQLNEEQKNLVDIVLQMPDHFHIMDFDKILKGEEQ